MADDTIGGVTVTMIQAAARIGSALQQGPITLRDAACICAGVEGVAWEDLPRQGRERCRSRARSIIDSISLVGGLPIAEDDLHVPTVYFLLRL